jgi:hypothetical protein
VHCTTHQPDRKDFFTNANLELKTLLVIGHPGHELRVYGWIAQAHPVVCILTDGSGSSQSPRIEESLALLSRMGAQIGPIWGEFSDREIYDHILKKNVGVFETLCHRIAELIVDRTIDAVVSDAVEGYNPTHDLCELLARNAVAVAAGRKRQPIPHYTVPLAGDPRTDLDGGKRGSLRIDLSVQQCREKLETARAYARGAGPKLLREVEDAIGAYGEDAFACEYLFLAATPDSGPERRFEHHKPAYECYGEEQVAAGFYRSVIRFREHMLPLANQLNAIGLAALPHEVA